VEQHDAKSNSSCAQTACLPHLQHEPLDDAVEEHAVVVAVLRVRREVLDRARALVGEELERDVSARGVEDGAARQYSGDACLALWG
jgi:hypothetical protein